MSSPVFDLVTLGDSGELTVDGVLRTLLLVTDLVVLFSEEPSDCELPLDGVLTLLLVTDLVIRFSGDASDWELAEPVTLLLAACLLDGRSAVTGFFPLFTTAGDDREERAETLRTSPAFPVNGQFFLLY